MGQDIVGRVPSGANERFGHSVSLSGDGLRMIVGSLYGDYARA